MALPSRRSRGTAPRLSALRTFALALALPIPLALAATPLTYDIVGYSGVSAQQMFLGTENKVYIVDKTENNNLTANGHPAWASEYDLSTNTVRPMDVVTNSFCAGGSTLGNGTWINAGGNQPVMAGGVQTVPQFSPGPYDNGDGGPALRLLDACDDQSCDWVNGFTMTGRRWYPTVETLQDGSVIIIGGEQWGGYVADASQNNPTYEFFPPKGDGQAIGMQFLTDTLPVNLYPLTWLLPSGRLFMQAEFQAILYDWQSRQVTPLPNIPNAVRVYPASAGTAMLPLTPANNYTPEVIFCGGTNLQKDQWGTGAGPAFNIVAYPAVNNCDKIKPDDPNPQWEADDPLATQRSMGQFIHLPDGTLWFGNGVAMGTAGYGNTSFAVGQSFGDQPVYMPAVYDPLAPAGHRWTSEGFQESKIARLYHSSATLVPDGSVLVSGSNPNVDVTTNHWHTEYTVERWYPSWYNAPRPSNARLPSNLTYGGAPFDLVLDPSDLGNNVTKLATTRVRVLRTGFSTHAMNMGMRYLELNSTYTADQSGKPQGTLHVSQMPPNPALFQPGPALLFVVVDGVPSNGKLIMIGSGVIGTQPTFPVTELPASQDAPANATAVGHAGGGKNAAPRAGVSVHVLALVAALALVLLP